MPAVGGQLVNPFITKVISLASGQALQIDVAHFQGKFLFSALQAGSAGYLFIGYGQDPTPNVDNTQTPPLPSQVGVLQAGDVYYIKNFGQGANPNFIWLMRPADGVAGNNTYELMFTTTDQVELLVNASNVAGGGSPGTVHFPELVGDVGGGIVGTYNLNTYPGVKTWLISMYGTENIFTDGGSISIQGYVGGAGGTLVFDRTCLFVTDAKIGLGEAFVGLAGDEWDTQNVPTDTQKDEFSAILPYPAPDTLVITMGVSTTGAKLTLWGR